MAVSTIQTSFAAGEISPELYGEVDLKKISAAATTLRNAVVNFRGGAMSRGGLAFVGRCKQSTTGTGPARPLPFQFSNTQAYVIEAGDQYFRFVYQGGYILENPVAITGATQANPCVISVAGSPFANGDWVFFAGVGGMSQLNGNTYIVAGEASGSFQLNDLNGNPVNSTSFGAYTSGGTASRLYTIATPYAAVDLPYLKFSQSADVMSLTCSNPITGTEYPPYDLARLAAASWTLTETSFDPVISPPSTVSASSNGQSPEGGTNATFAYQITAVDSLGNESIASAIATCHGANIQTQAGANTVNYSSVAGAKYYNIYRAPGAVDTTGVGPNPVPAGSIFGFVGSSYGTQYVDSNTTPDISQTPPLHLNPFAPGQILAVDITNPGSGLTAVNYTISTSTGVNFSGLVLVSGGGLGGILIQNPGSLYKPSDSIAFNGAGFAEGSILFATNPNPLDTITLNGVVWTFVTAISGPNQTLIGTSLQGTLAQLASNLSASSNASLSVASYTIDVSNTYLLIVYKAAGTAGNAYTLAASAATVSGGTLTGGSGAGYAGTAASGSLTFTTNPTNGQTIVLEGVTWTFVTSGATGNQTNLGVSLAATLTQLQSDLTASTNASIALANYAVSSTVLTITYKTVGTAGNAYTLGVGTAGDTRSAPTLTGGANSSTTPAGTLTVGPQSGTYPGVVNYFQQRRFYACSLNNPDTFWASQTGLFKNFDAAIPTIATDAITASPWTEQVNGIQWLVAMPGGLLAMTGQRAWQIVGQGSYALNVQPITPSATQAQPQAFNGCSPTIQPIVIDQDIIYVEAVGNTTVRDFSYNFFTSIYTGADLTLLSSHLFDYQQMVYSAWARKPYKVMWAPRDDGTMISLTYLKEQEVYGWARHDTLGLVVGIASITEPPVNAIYAIVQRFPPSPAPSTGIYVMERMDNRVWQTVEDAYCVDSGVSNPLVSPAASLVASAATGSSVVFSASAACFGAGSVGQIIRMSGGIATVTGFTDTKHVVGTWNLAANAGAIGLPYEPAGDWTIAAPVTALNAPHLAGMSVVGLADGVPIGPITVGATGLVTLPFAASNVKVGLPFTVQVQSPYLNGQGVVQGSRKVIPAASFRLQASGNGFQTGTNQPDGAAQDPPQMAPAWSNLTTGNLANATGGQNPPATYNSPAGELVTQLWTGDIRITGQGASWNSKGQVAIQQALPLPLNILAIMPEVVDGDVPERGYSQEQGQSQPQRPRGPGMHMLKEARI